MAEDSSSSTTHRSPGGVGQLVAAICVAIFVVLLLQGLYAFLVFRWLGDMETQGQFGDTFGAVNAFFTGLAFAGVIYTIFLQRKELELQRVELRENRAELRRSADAQSEQVERLEEAAELSAISTLVRTYGTLLQPVRDVTHGLRVETVRQQLRRNNPDINQKQQREASEKETQLQAEIRTQERGWGGLIRKEQDLVRRLEKLVDQRSQGSGTTQEPQ